MYDHDLPRVMNDRLGAIADLLTEIRDRLPTPVRDAQPVAGDGPQPVDLREPDPPVQPAPAEPPVRKPPTRRRNQRQHP